jgi:hypothetical protein
MPDDTRLTRRQLLVALGAMGVGVGAGIRLVQEPRPLGEVALGPARTPTRTPTPHPTPTRPEILPGEPAPTETVVAEPEPPPTEEPPPPPEPPEPHALVAGEVYREAKELAAAVALQLTTFAAGEAPDEILVRGLVRPRGDIDLDAAFRAVQPLLAADAESRGRVVYPQLGGLAPAERPETASVMVITEQALDGPGVQRTVTRVLDVRLILLEGMWLVDRIASAGGTEVPRPPDLPPEAVAVLDDERIHLPDSARWDIHEGIVDVRVLRAMSEIAALHPIGVTTLRNGHPERVFGTDRISNHTLGRGVDIWRVGDQAVVTQQPDQATPAWQVNHELFARAEVSELGGPWAFDGFGGRSFTNDVHLDHLHVAFRR